VADAGDLKGDYPILRQNATGSSLANPRTRPYEMGRVALARTTTYLAQFMARNMA
jgi:hypothetical protein